MDELAQLRAEMLRGNQAKSQLAGLDEQFTRANSMRDAGMTAPNKYGYASPLQAVADIMKNSTGRRQARELAPQREAARQAIGASANALPLYQAQQQLNKDAQAQDNYEATALAKTSAAQKLAAVKADDRSLATYIDAQTGETFTVGNAANGRSYVMDAEGNETAIDMSTLVPQSEYIARQKAQTTADKAARYGGLTSAALQTGLKEYRKKVDTLSPIVQGVNNLNEMLAGLPDANKDIPGIGVIEGGSGSTASAVRYAKDILGGDSTAQKINAAWTQTIAPLIREQAGLAQTKIELDRVEKIYGADWLSDEDVFRTQYPQIMKRLQEDLQTMEGTFLPAVGNYYKDTMKEIGADTIFERAKFNNPFAVKGGALTKKQQEVADRIAYLKAKLAEEE